MPSPRNSLTDMGKAAADTVLRRSSGSDTSSPSNSRRTSYAKAAKEDEIAVANPQCSALLSNPT